ncbi:MAG: hypothetical protein QXI58_00565 [Candidatus Micrarchaeia archaeon]
MIISNAAILARIANDSSAGLSFIRESQRLAEEFFGVAKKEAKSYLEELQNKYEEFKDKQIVVTPKGIQIKKIE